MLKPVKRLRSSRRGERKLAITEQAEEEAGGIVARAKAKASAMMAQVCGKSLINKMMINWAEKQAPEDRQATEDALDAMT